MQIDWQLTKTLAVPNLIHWYFVCIYIQTQALARSADHVFHVCGLCFQEWLLLSSLSDEKWATVCRSNYLVIFSPSVHTHTHSRKSQSRSSPAFGEDNPFDGMIRVFISGPHCFHGTPKSGTLHWIVVHYSSYLASQGADRGALAGGTSAVISVQLRFQFIWMEGDG